MRSALDVMMDSIVDPRCDECGAGVHPGGIGPHLCPTCSARMAADFDARFRDWLSQERPRGRRVHVVRLPDGMRR